MDERIGNQNGTQCGNRATANKLARISWAVLASGDDYQPRYKAPVFSN